MGLCNVCSDPIIVSPQVCFLIDSYSLQATAGSSLRWPGNVNSEKKQHDEIRVKKIKNRILGLS